MFEFWIDVGGTFTDCLAVNDEGQTTGRAKVLSSGEFMGIAGPRSDGSCILDPARCGDPPGFWTGYQLCWRSAAGTWISSRVREFDHRQGGLWIQPALNGLVSGPAGAGWEGRPYRLISDEEAPVLAMRYLLGLRRTEAMPACRVRLGTTRGTNALLTGTGARTGLAITRGFGDLPWIGDQARPELFRMHVQKPRPICRHVVEIQERVAADGRVLQPLHEPSVRTQLQSLRSQGIESLAICLMHSFRSPRHELQVDRIARELGFVEVTRSSEVAPVIKIVPRCDTTVADAYLTPVLRTYVERVRTALGGDSELQLFGSDGGLHRAVDFRGRDCLFSGPAGGVVGLARAAEASGLSRVIGYDMGGTSTDVSRYAGEFAYRYETRKFGVRIVAPTLAIDTVAAGGGSLCRFDGVKLTVGPESAGAVPGPACYGRGGPLTVTDLNLLLGRLLPQYFPFPLDRHAAQHRLRDLVTQVNQQSGRTWKSLELAEGLIRIANAHMARAIESVSVKQGADPRHYTLVAFGGAAPQHACDVAQRLGMRQVLIHADASLLSAWGIGLAEVSQHEVAGIYRRLDDQSLDLAENTLKGLAATALARVEQAGVDRSMIHVAESCDVRYVGQAADLRLSFEPRANLPARFHTQHKQRFGFASEAVELELVAVRVHARGGRVPRPVAVPHVTPQEPVACDHATIFWQGQNALARVYQQSELPTGACFGGPALVAATHSVTLVEPGWQAEVPTAGQLILSAPRAKPAAEICTFVDPVLLEVFYHAFMGIAEQMGDMLQRTAVSVNVKERLDFSCALFTETGSLVANAPHVPVHLGAMSETIRCVLQDYPNLTEGDVVVTNDPSRGGSHLPDVTVVTPVHDPLSGDRVGFTASRAHHAELGGITPGSMPPQAKCLAEEGILIRSFKIIEEGVGRWDVLTDLLQQEPYPSRAVADNVADIKAQVAANRQGAAKLLRLTEQYGLATVLAYFEHIQIAAAKKMRATLRSLPTGRRSFVDHLDDGSAIAVAVQIREGHCDIDFTGSAGVHAGNLNANPAIVRAAVIYALRCLLHEEIPLNDGVLRPISLTVPPGILNPPFPADSTQCPAVVGGNVETSQRIVDVLLGAFGVAAASQGTMNNVLFGNERFGYYETVGGGSGATPDGPGADAVQVHMTNTRITDPEVLEQRYPVRLLEFRLRRGSGGSGRFRGGHGIVRQLQFLQPLRLSLLTQRRGPYPPYGIDGGSPGKLGVNTLLRVDKNRRVLPAIASFDVAVGDILEIKTPGGGGVGPSP